MTSDQATLYDDILLREFLDDSADQLDNSKNNLLNPKDYESLVNSVNFTQLIPNSLNNSPAEVLFKVLKFSLENKLPIMQISNLLKLVNSFFIESVIFDSKYYIEKILSEHSKIEFHGICPTCNIYLGQIEEFKTFITCQSCGEKIDSNNPSCANMFILIDPSDKIRRLLESNQDYYYYIMHERKYNGIIRDIYDGRAYRKFVKSLPEADRYNYITACLNTDGAPRFESSSYSIWPVYIQLNEIPLNCTGKNVITIGLWFGKNKPNMTAFLTPVVNLLNNLSVNSIKCCVKNVECNIKLFVLLVCVDAVARAPMQGTMQFNAHYGCEWCLHPGDYYERSTRYPNLKCPAQLRTHDQTIDYMRDFLNNGMKKSIFGVRDVSPLALLDKFDIIIGFVVDYLHCSLGGVGKQITECILDTLSGYQIDDLDSKLISIKVPHQMCRLTRKLSERGQWKAKEWENYILFYSLPLLFNVVSARVFNYWSLFVNALYILLKKEITCNELNEADEMLHEFVRNTQKIFKKRNMTYNIHQLLHLATSVMHWGPLYSHSTFPFESANHQLLEAIHCAKGVNLQILRFINIQNVVEKLKEMLCKLPSHIIISNYDKICNNRLKKCIKIENITYLGSGKIAPNALINLFQMNPHSLLYPRAIIDGCLYASNSQMCKRSNNSFAQLKNNEFIYILDFAVDAIGNIGSVIYYSVKTGAQLSKFMFYVDKIDDKVMLKNSSEIRNICIYINLNNKAYIAGLPNMYNN
ncbi:hypothetical protein TKK_0005767 [Trichogramma kaykai]